jgi:hypothetical protein
MPQVLVATAARVSIAEDATRRPQAQATGGWRCSSTLGCKPSGRVQDLARWVVAVVSDKVISRESLKALLAPLRLEDGTLSEIPPSPYYPWRGEAVGGLLLVPVVVLTNTQESNPDWIVGDVSRKYLASSEGGK